MMAAYGAADDGSDSGGDLEGDGGLEVRGGPAEVAAERRRILGSGVAYGAIASVVVCVPVIVFSQQIADLAGDPALQSSVAWMAASACTGAIWRTVHQVYRFERRPVAWAMLQCLRPALAIAFTIWALMRGFGIDGVLAATALATALSCACSLMGSRHCYSLHPRAGDLPLLWRIGRQWIPLNLAFALQANAGVILLAFIAPASAVGLFQVANRLGSIPSYAAHGFLAGWAPMQRSPVAMAAQDRKGVREASASLFTLFAAGTLVVLIVIVGTASSLILIAAPAYRTAVELIPLLAMGHVANTSLTAVYRATSFPSRRAWFVALHVIWIAPYASCLVVTNTLAPAYSVAVAQLTAGVVVTSLMVFVDRRAPTPTPFAWGRIARLLGIVGVCGAVFQFASLSSLASLGATIVIFALLPWLLLRARVITPAQAATLKAIVVAWLKLGGAPSQLRRRVQELSRNQKTPIDLLILGSVPLHEAAEAAVVPERLLLARMVRGLRDVLGKPDHTTHDGEIGAYLLLESTTLERDVHMRDLKSRGVDPYELHMLQDLVRRLRAAHRHDRAHRPQPDHAYADDAAALGRSVG